MVDVNWFVAVVRAARLPLNFILILKYWGQDIWCFNLTFCNPFLILNSVLSPQYFFYRFWVLYLQASSSFLLLLVVSHSIFFLFPWMVLNSCSLSLRKCNVCTVCFLNTLLLQGFEYLFPIMLGRLNAREQFRAMAEAPIPLSSISLDETSSSAPVDRELQPVRSSSITLHY